MKRTFEQVTNLDRLIETQKPDTVSHGRQGVELEWHERLIQKLESDTDRIKSAQIIAKAIVQGQQMAISTPKLNSLGAAFQNMVERVENAADGVHKKMGDTASYAENAVTKFAGGADYIHGLAKQIDDTANQMIGGNGGPPLDSTNLST